MSEGGILKLSEIQKPAETLFKFTLSKKMPQEVKASLGLGQIRRSGYTVGQTDCKSHLMLQQQPTPPKHMV